MNTYENLNNMIAHIENNLIEKPNFKELAKMVCTNEYVLQRMFSLLTDITINDYIRKRKLSKAGTDLVEGNIKIIDLASKYGYESATAFARAFQKFHGINPSEVTSETILKRYPIIRFSTNEIFKDDYQVTKKDSFELYGIGESTELSNIKNIAPKLWNENPNANFCRYGVVKYENSSEGAPATYYIASDKEFHDAQKIVIPKSEWLVFTTVFSNQDNLLELLKNIFVNFLPNSDYEINHNIEIEVYKPNSFEYWLSVKRK